MGFFLSFFAGLSTLFGCFPIFFSFKNEKKIISSGLSFASGVMFFVSIVDLIPVSISILGSSFWWVGIFFILFGILFGYVMDYKFNNNSLYDVGIISMISIILHNIPEGIITFVSTTMDVRLGIFLSIAIILHNIPEGISISVPIYYATGSKIKGFFYTFISGFSEFLGAIDGYFFFPFFSEFVLGCLFSFIAGVMLFVSIFELFPKSFSYGYYKLGIILFVIGCFFMMINLILFG